MKLLGISGTIIGSKTLVVTQKVLEEARRSIPDIETELLDLKQYNIELCDGREPSSYNEDTRKLIDTVSSADGYIVGTPIFHGSFPGVLKNLLDLVPAETFRHKVMGFIAIGGNDQHYLMIENQLKPIAGYFHSYVAPEYVFAHNKDFNEKNEIISQELLDKINNLANEVCTMQKILKAKK
ncbi:NADH-dependent FMN reductase [Pueribacillus theae]|uniref:NADH-dependent FMN reductase n=1 Tax=Pueribacillus theae TaxID=2171751 RepID=A0A2U1JS44_9BACI|nr:NAD(P)H-dependent oxidoreductase [Pueribacillus theae]PWA07825.1 NADH-dependent FMN reductase [Pueribacillus theae]